MKPKSSKNKIPKLGIAFGRGAARGFAHIGVLEALSAAEDERLMPQLISGTSTGSIMGALYASGLSIEDIKSATENMAWAREVVDVSRSIRDSLIHLTGALLPWGLENWLKNDMGIETTSLMDMEQREALIAQARAATEARLEDLTQRVDHPRGRDGQG